VETERWRQIEQLFHAALERNAGERPGFLEQACGGDQSLRREAESLLAQSEEGDRFLEAPALEVAAKQLAREHMPLSAGTKLGPYEIRAPVGKGGMGEVYRAHDSRLNRDVAIKVSNAQFTERFTREARAIAALNHTNICHLYDVGPNYLVMELIEGVPLKGPLPVEKAMEYAAQILDALDAAHCKGITHRDLKPANILVTKQGIKLLDFGLAQMAPGPNDPTMTQMTQAGAAVGTPAYMAPEQWEGKRADARSDIYSFGCVLYEMLTGKRAVQERTPVEPAALEGVLGTCLEKDPDERWQSARELKHALRWVAEAKPATSVSSRSRLSKTGWLAAVVFALIAAIVSFLHFLEKPTETPVRFTIAPPEKTSFTFGPGGSPNGFPALSPDGRRLVFGAQPAGGTPRLWVRSLDATTPQPLAGTEGALLPFWSPDGHSIGFGANGKLKKIDPSGGPALPLADAPALRGASWSTQGVILFTPTRTSALLRIPAAGGPTTPATVLDPARKENSHRWPWFLPDGRHFLYAAVATDGDSVLSDATIYAGSLDSRESRIVAQASSNAVYASGYLLFLRDNTLMAQPFDAKRLATTGEAVPMAEQIADSPASLRGFFAATENGTLVFQPGLQSLQTLTWLDRMGKRVAAVGEPGKLLSAFLSPDGKHATVSVFDRVERNNHLWLYDLARNLPGRFTLDSANENEGVWSPDGSRIVFNSSRNGHLDLYSKLASGAGTEELVYADGLNKHPTSWSTDGKFIAYYAVGDPKTGSDLWVLPLAGERKPFPFLKTAFNELSGQFSPDGHWVAYQSNESGRGEIYISPFPGSGGKSQVSLAGGSLPRWRADGKELFFVAPDRSLIATEIGVKGSELVIGAPRALFGPLLAAGYQAGYQYDVSPDGQRFLAVLPNEQASPPEPLTLVLNWTAGLKK
jgi:eukaryotic-like serine/threonine-protein kinase